MNVGSEGKKYIQNVNQGFFLKQLRLALSVTKEGKIVGRQIDREGRMGAEFWTC